MERKDFLKKSAIGIGALSIIPMINACKSESKKEIINEPLKSEVTELQKPKIVKENEGNKLNVLGDNQNIKLTGALSPIVKFFTSHFALRTLMFTTIHAATPTLAHDYFPKSFYVYVCVPTPCTDRPRKL